MCNPLLLLAGVSAGATLKASSDARKQAKAAARERLRMAQDERREADLDSRDTRSTSMRDRRRRGTSTGLDLSAVFGPARSFFSSAA